MRISTESLGFLYLFAIPFIVQPLFSNYSQSSDDDVSGYVDERFQSVLEVFK